MNLRAVALLAFAALSREKVSNVEVQLIEVANQCFDGRPPLPSPLNLDDVWLWLIGCVLNLAHSQVRDVVEWELAYLAMIVIYALV